MNPLAEARGVPLARHDTAGATVEQCTWATIPAHNAGMFGWGGAVPTVGSVRRTECLSRVNQS
jgi:hypothetical protein